MSYYGAKISNNYTLHKRRLQANGIFRFGGASFMAAYTVPESPEGSAQVPVTASDSDPTVRIITTGASDCVSVALKENTSNVAIQNAHLIDVATEYKLQPGTHAALLEGSLTVDGGQMHDSNSEIAIVVADQQELTLTGTCKLITFTLSA